jgi:hypothetical protein
MHAYKFKQKLQDDDITDEDLQKIATKLIYVDYIDQHPDHPSDLIYQPSFLHQYGEPQPSSITRPNLYVCLHNMPTLQLSLLDL